VFRKIRLSIEYITKLHIRKVSKVQEYNSGRPDGNQIEIQTFIYLTIRFLYFYKKRRFI